MMAGLGVGWEACGGGCSVPMCMLENISRGMSSGGDDDLMVGCGECESSWVDVWLEGTGLVGFFPSDVDVSADAA